MKQEQRKILIYLQNNTFFNRNNFIRLSSHNSEKPGTQNLIRRDINDLKQVQEKLVQSQEKIVQGQDMIITELRKMRFSIDNLAREVGRLAQINNKRNNSKKNSLNQNLNSDFSKHSSGPAIYGRRNKAKNNNKKEDNTEQVKEIPKPKVNQITTFKYFKINLNEFNYMLQELRYVLGFTNIYFFKLFNV